MRGAAHLSQNQDAIVVDIGGTTTDVGVLVSGFPRPASTRVNCGGVTTNFRMPDVFSIALGGGSIVSNAGAKVTEISQNFTSILKNIITNKMSKL